ncbi:GNAT family N-acetyltransferase [Bosea sp. TAF32]|uniref:GNAT family N-acetyltransferase n=1 Tax=Bosea sp. TAF32 TaxID=3237482 RepID=UPI003F933B6F
MRIDIRLERPGDEAEIAEVTTAAFATAPHSSGTEAAIVSGLRGAGALSLSLVAIEGGGVIGHVAFSPIEIAEAMGAWHGLGPVSVSPLRQRHGIGGALIEEGLAQLRASGAAGVVVLGDPAFYSRFGFASDGGLRFGDVPPSQLQWLSFKAVTPRGEVRYHPAFG